jgi:hypothetical protein
MPSNCPRISRRTSGEGETERDRRRLGLRVLDRGRVAATDRVRLDALGRRDVPLEHRLPCGLGQVVRGRHALERLVERGLVAAGLSREHLEELVIAQRLDRLGELLDLVRIELRVRHVSLP